MRMRFAFPEINTHALHSRSIASGAGCLGVVLRQQAEMGLLLERAQALLRDRGALREEAETYLNEAAAAHWIYGKVYSDKMSVADASEAFMSVVERLTSAYKANDAELRQALETLQGSSGELKGVQVIL